MRSVMGFGATLGVICVAATALLASTNAFTRERIAAQTRQELEDSLKEVMSDGKDFQPVIIENETAYYKVFDDSGKRIGAAFLASAKGYSSEIKTIAGIAADGKITTIKVMSQAETPGLGSRITEIAGTLTVFDFFKGKKRDASLQPWFQAQFNGKDIRKLDEIKAITGATISSKAVIDSVKQKADRIREYIKNE